MTVNVVQEIGQVVTKTAAKLNKTIYYMYGHPIEIQNNLVELTRSPKSKDKKFPLVILFTDIKIQRNKPSGFYGSAKLQMVVANITKPEYKAPERLANNFKTVLHPIKDEFIKQLQLHKQFSFDGEVLFDDIDRYYWGKSANTFNDYLDCIELQDIEVIIKNKNCSPSNNL